MKRTLDVPGAPVPQGSMRAFAVKGRAFITNTESSPLARYRTDIRGAYGDPEPSSEPIVITCIFIFKRPDSHYNAKGDLKDESYATPAPMWVTKKPDVDKLLRSILDALTGYAYDDDAQVVQAHGSKLWGKLPSTVIDVMTMGDHDDEK